MRTRPTRGEGCLNDKLTAAAKAKTASERPHHLQAFSNQVRTQTGKALTAEQARILLELAEALAKLLRDRERGIR